MVANYEMREEIFLTSSWTNCHREACNI